MAGCLLAIRRLSGYRLKRIALLLIAAGTSPAPAQVSDVSSVDIVPAWEGYYRASAATELTVLVHAAGETALRADVQGSSPAASVSMTVGPVALGMAVRPTGNDLVVTTALGGLEPQETMIELTALSRPLVAIVADRATDLIRWLAADDAFQPIPVATSELPRTTAGYAPVSGLVLGRDVRPELEPGQRAALDAYLSHCGRVFATAADARAALIGAAGCGGRFVTTVAGPGDIAAELPVQADALPRYDALRRLLGGPPRLLLVATAFLGLYCLFVAGLALCRQRGCTALLLAAPMLASVLMLAVWARETPESRLLVWAERQDQEPARYRAVLLVYSQGIGTVELALDPTLGLPATFATDPLALVHRGDGPDVLRWQPALLSRMMIGLDGSATVSQSLVIGTDAAGPSVQNAGTSASPESILAHRGTYYRVPSLGPGESWSPADGAASLSRADFPAPLAGAGPTALLVALRPDQIPRELPRADVESGWLVQRAVVGEP